MSPPDTRVTLLWVSLLMHHPFEPTAEQRAILAAFQRGENLCIHAFAGTGKTSTLYYLAKNTNKRGLYLAFNRHIAEEAQRKMPANVVSKTMHAYAFAWAICFYLKEKLVKSWQPHELRYVIQIPHVPKLNGYLVARLIKNTLVRFCQSYDEDIEITHIPLDDSLIGARLNSESRLAVVNAAKEVWHLMKDRQSELPLGFDGYLKLWSLSKPRLPFDFLCIDEAQDLNPVMLRVLDHFQGQKILVGDSHQQIYSWRGAVNAMEYDFSALNYHLTQTFRFGPTLAECANVVLNKLEATRYMVSASPTGTVVTTQQSSVPNAYLYRKNVTLLLDVIRFHQEGQEYHLVDAQKLEVLVKDYFRLCDGEWAKSPLFEGFKTWDEVVAASKTPEGLLLRSIVRLFETHEPEYIEKAIKESEKRASLNYPSLSTVHQSKGLEWPVVALSDDFNLVDDTEDEAQEKKESEDKEELRLLYVALTRAKDRLILPWSVWLMCKPK